MKNKTIKLAFLIPFILICSCDDKIVVEYVNMNSRPSTARPSSLDNPEPSLFDYVKGSNEFGFKMFSDAYSLFAEDKPDIVFSPLGGQIIKALMINQMDTEVNADKELLLDSSFNDYFRGLTERLSDISNTQAPVSVSNLVMMYNRGEFPEKMNEIYKKCYHANYSIYDDSLPSGERPGDLWAKEKSYGLIDTLPHLKVKGVDYYGYYLVALSCLKGVIDSSRPLVEEGLDHTSYTLPIVGSQLRFTALLPDKESSIKDLINHLDAEKWESIRKNQVAKDLSVIMPDVSSSFIVKDYYSLLNQDFKSLYWNTAEMPSPQNMDEWIRFSYWSIAMTSSIQLSGISGADPSKSNSVTVNGPVVYIISDAESGLVLFMGTRN